MESDALMRRKATDNGFYIIQDDMSELGLRRVHLMRSRAFGEEEIREIEQVLMPVLTAPSTAGGSTPPSAQDAYVQEDCATIRWVDEVGNAHLYLAWRCLMETMVVGSGEFGEALRTAAGGYFRRFGELPNRVVVREGMDVPEEVDLCLTPGPTLATVITGVGSVVAKVERVKWMRMGDVGVYYSAGGSFDGAQDGVKTGDSGGLPHEDDRRVEV